MISLGDTTYSFSDPLVLIVLAAIIFGCVVVVLLFVAVRRVGHASVISEILASQMGAMSQRVN